MRAATEAKAPEQALGPFLAVEPFQVVGLPEQIEGLTTSNREVGVVVVTL
ncbi:MAG: hypothetical protein ACLQAT_27380 [Candidatus Binataceae bacterium]